MNLNDYFYLNRSGRYTNPLNSNDRLPIPYGDLTDGSNGNWILPCIDTVNFVYCLADSAVLSVANGNSINIYADGDLVAGANYTFDESNDYEGLGNIATITFTADQENKVISARGKGKASGATLMENIVDIVNDFLTVENSFASADYEATLKARAKAIFTAQGYKAAGVIHKDVNIWELLQKMMGSFLGSVYMNGEGKLVLDIDDGSLSQYGPASIIPRADVRLKYATQKLSNLINQCPASYAYNYAKLEFAKHTDDSAYADSVSQGIYGVRKPTLPYQFYWCRDLTSVQAIQDIIVGKFAYPLWETEFEDVSFKRSHVDTGDIVAATFDCLYEGNEDELVNQLFRIFSVKPSFNKNEIRFRALDTGYFMTIAYLLDGSWLLDGSKKLGLDKDITKY